MIILGVLSIFVAYCVLVGYLVVQEERKKRQKLFILRMKVVQSHFVEFGHRFNALRDSIYEAQRRLDRLRMKVLSKGNQ